MKTLGEVLTLSTEYLKNKQIPYPRKVCEALLCFVLKKTRVDLYSEFDLPLEESELVLLRQLLKQALMGEPVEYITSQVDFLEVSLKISKNVLIPRVETEILVDLAMKWMGDTQGKIAWDLCTGSGCIGLALKKKYPLLDVTLSDLSEKALEIAKLNAKENDLEVSFVLGDLLVPFIQKKADYVFSNPPYVSMREYEQLSFSVKNFEPKEALIGGVTGFEFYERLAEALPSRLHRGGKVFLEIGATQGRGVMEIFSSPKWVSKELMQDWSGKDRFFFLEIE